MYEQIIYEVSDPIATITLNRPERLNAFTNRMGAELKHAFAAAEKDQRVVGIILTGAGRGFCAGADMGGLDDISKGKTARRLPRVALPCDPNARAFAHETSAVSA